MALTGDRPAPPAARSTAPATDWTVQIADTIESVVGSIRNKTTVPLETVARAIVYGVVIAVVGSAALLLATIALVRAATYIPGVKVWMVYGILGTLLTVAGLLLWRKRRPSDTQVGGKR